MDHSAKISLVQYVPQKPAKPVSVKAVPLLAAPQADWTPYFIVDFSRGILPESASLQKSTFQKVLISELLCF